MGDQNNGFIALFKKCNGMVQCPLASIIQIGSCLNNIMLISNDITVLNFYNLVVDCLTSQTNSYQRNNCDSCVKNYFSPQQLNILSRFFDGQSVSEISNELMVSKSTIYSHKRYVMTRYNLRTKHELYFFWKLVNNRIRDS